jgi:diadenosine tetraphosphate (Ap4A) HIT family hydrolase
VVPDAHVELFRDMSSKVSLHLFNTVLQVVEAVRRSGLRADGINIFVSEVEAAGQDVFPQVSMSCLVTRAMASLWTPKPGETQDRRRKNSTNARLPSEQL